MTEIQQHIAAIRQTLPEGVSLLCVSKFQPIDAIREAYDAGERDFGESRVQELLLKHEALPKDIRWHFIGHLQTNKVRQIVPFIHLIHSVDSEHLLACINREAEKIGQNVNVLLELHVAEETSKTGFTPDELDNLTESISRGTLSFPFVNVRGVMGMATNTDDRNEWRRCFRLIADAGRRLQNGMINSHSHTEPAIVSMGMSEDYPVAVEEGSTMVRIGSSVFGARNYA